MEESVSYMIEEYDVGLCVQELLKLDFVDYIEIYDRGQLDVMCYGSRSRIRELLLYTIEYNIIRKYDLNIDITPIFSADVIQND